MKKKVYTILLFCFPLLILLSMSLLLMYHATFITNIYHMHFMKQCIWIGIGIGILIIHQRYPNQLLFKYSFYLYIFSILSLLLVLLIGENINGSKAWINLKWFLFQPSELMKLTYSLYLSKLISSKRFYKTKQELFFLMRVLFLWSIPTILVFLEPDTGAILFYSFITITALWNSNLRKRWLISIFIILLIGISLLFYGYFFQRDFLISILGTSIFYRMERLFSIGEGMQIKHALIALGSAPLFQWKINKTGIYIPESPTDFIFALSSNVFGTIGNYIILISYLCIDIYFINYSKTLTNKELKIFTQTFLSIFIPSQILNIGMNLGLLPIIGIPLPFLSYGGSSTITLFIYLSILFFTSKKDSYIEVLEIPSNK